MHEQCFMEPLKKVQVEGHLMFAEPHELFGNLDELCYVRCTVSSNSTENLLGCLQIFSFIGFFDDLL